ncbi:MAG: long-chain fatty acid--CoA ligase [Burkholderiaceae bacterium]|jgi:fatty-acyl-CoA synthase|nr:long-chain fatty acid--CoA ligase [Burkholderiaceae bacterium]
MSLDEWIEEHAKRTPDRIAIRFPGRDLRYAQFARQIRRLAAALSRQGVGRGGCVAWLGYNSPEMLELLFAAARLGAMFMPLNWRLAAPEHRQMLADCPPGVLVVEPAFVAQTDAYRGALEGVRLVTFSDAPSGWTSWTAFLDGAEETGLPPAADFSDEPLLVCYTSGSTGKPKGVLLTQRALDANAANSVAMHEMTADDRILTTLPLFHVGGLNNQTTPALRIGATVVLHPRFDVEPTFDAIERERITLTVLVPAQLDPMMAHPRWVSADLSSLRMITTGSTIVPEKLIRDVHERGIPMAQVYGATETCPIAAYQRREDALRVGSAGRAAKACELRIVDDYARDVEPGASGEILVRGPNVMRGYWNDRTATDAALIDGWFHTGDVGHLDADGFLWVDGRKKDMIISGSENIYPAEIENVLIESPDIEEASVVGRPDPRWGEIVVAVVVRRPGSTIDADGVLALLENRIARFKHPKDVVFVDALPKTALGKVRKEEVRRFAAQTGEADAATEHHAGARA